MFPARAVALGCVFISLDERCLGISEDVTEWVDQISSGKVDIEDFKEIILELQDIK